jgi:hypothetical protein
MLGIFQHGEGATLYEYIDIPGSIARAISLGDRDKQIRLELTSLVDTRESEFPVRLVDQTHASDLGNRKIDNNHAHLDRCT